MTWTTQAGAVFDTAKLRRRWEAGRCVCCGGVLRGNVKAIAEGVQICGKCNDGNHIQRPGELREVLRALVSVPGQSGTGEGV